MGGYLDFKIYGISVTDAEGKLIKYDSPEYSKRSNQAINEVVEMYYQEKKKSLDDKMSIIRSFNNKWSELLHKKKNSNNIRNEDYKEVIKSIIKENKFTTPYRLTKFLLAIPKIQKEGIQKNFIQRIYNSIEQEDMDKVNEIDTVDKALAFAKGHREYIQLRSKKLTNEQIEEKQKNKE